MIGTSKAADLIRQRDWTSHPLGPPEGWPAALRIMLGNVLSSPESMFLSWGKDLTFFFNDAYVPILGPRVEEAMGARFPELWADGWPDISPIVEKALAGEASRFDDHPIMLARYGEPERTWWTFSYSPAFDETGAIAGMLCIANETTSRILSEKRLRATEGRNRQIIDSAIDYAIIATDNAGHVTRWNEGARRILGWTEDEMLGEPVHRFFTEEDVANGVVEAEMRSALAVGRGNDERWHRRKTGERFWASGEMTVLRDDDDHVIGFVKVLRDRTDQRLADEERRRLAEELSRLNKQLATDVSRRTAERDRLWESSPDLLVMLDLDGVFRQVNPAWTTALGHAPADLIGKQVNSLVHPDDVLLTEMALQDASHGSLPIVENRYRHKDGSYRQISWVAAPDPDHGIIYATGRDVTIARAAEQALRHAEDQLRQSQKVEAVGQLTGGVAHDFNNLLTVIRGSVDLLRRPNLTEDRRARYIDAIADTADRATKLTSQLLAFARRQTLKPTVFDARKNLVNLQDMLATLTGSRIEVIVQVPEETCLVNADPAQFDTAIVNMAVNARDAMDGAGVLTIKVAGAAEMPALRSHPAVKGDFVAVSLTDTGAGIAAEQINHIFEPFFTTKGVGHGTGLGLSQVFGFAKQTGGEIAVDSREGEGATFTLYLPRSATADAEEEASNSEGAAPGADACVLIVEDNFEVGSFATEALRELGYRTRLVAEAQQALAELKNADGAYDIVFSDVVMPGMSGVELGQEIRRLYPNIPVILASGYSSVLAETGTHGFELLQKPYSIDELSNALRKSAACRALTPHKS